MNESHYVDLIYSNGNFCVLLLSGLFLVRDFRTRRHYKELF